MKYQGFGLRRMLVDAGDGKLQRDRINISDYGDAIAEMDVEIRGDLCPIAQAVRPFLNAAN